MVPRQSRAGEVYTRYRDDDDGATPRPAETSSRARSAVSHNERLLQEVLGETLVRNRECPEELVSALRTYRARHKHRTCDRELFAEIAREVLRVRLGKRTDEFPADLFDEVGQALWTNEDSRARVERLWDSLGETHRGQTHE